MTIENFNFYSLNYFYTLNNNDVNIVQFIFKQQDPKAFYSRRFTTRTHFDNFLFESFMSSLF